MTKELVVLKENKAITTSLRVAEVFGKRHDNVVRDIENLIEKGVLNFEVSEYVVEGQFKPYKMYKMDRDGFTLLAMGFTGTRALDFKLKYINEFNKMEQYIVSLNTQPQFQIPQTLPEALRLAAEQCERADKAEAQIELDKPKVEAYDVFINSVGYYTLTTSFKLLGLRPRKHIAKMREDKILYKLKGENMPYERYIKQGLFIIRAIAVCTGPLLRSYSQTLVTPKGLDFLRKQYL